MLNRGSTEGRVIDPKRLLGTEPLWLRVILMIGDIPPRSCMFDPLQPPLLDIVQVT